MARVLLCTTFITISLLAWAVNCQDEDGGESSFVDRLGEILRNFYERMRKLWKDLKEEIKSRMSDMGEWSQEAWDSFKRKMKDWVDERKDISESEKDDMRNYIERMQMPDEKSE